MNTYKVRVEFADIITVEAEDEAEAREKANVEVWEDEDGAYLPSVAAIELVRTDVDAESSASRQHYIDTGTYLERGESTTDDEHPMVPGYGDRA